MHRSRRPLDPNPAQREGLRAEQLFLVLDIIKQASTSLDPPTFFRLLVETIYREVKTFSHVSIFGWDPDRRSVRAMAMAGEGGGGHLTDAKRTAPAGALAEAIRTGRSYLSNNLMTEARGAHPIAQLSRSALCIPIRAGQRILALLNIESRETRVFSPHDVALFEILCEHLANFLQGLHLYGEIRDKSVKIQNLSEICRRVFGASSLSEALDVAVRSVVEEYGYDAASVAFVTDDGGHLVHQADHARVPVPPHDGQRQPIGEGIVAKVVAQRRTVCWNDTTVEPGHLSWWPDARAELCIPLLAGERLVGVLRVHALEANAFDSEDVSLLETLGRQLALVVEKTRYLEHTRRTRDYLESLIDNAGDGILVLDAGGTIIRWNQRMERMIGSPAREAVGRSFRDLAAVGELHLDEEVFRRARAGQILENVEQRVRGRDGRPVDVVLTLSPIRGEDDQFEGVSIIVRDVTERRALSERVWSMHRQILEAEEKFLALVEKSPDAIFFVDAQDARILQANARAETQTGCDRSQLIGRHIADLHMPEDRAVVISRLEGTVSSGAADSVEARLLRATGQPLEVEATPSLLSHGGRTVVQWVCRDLSDRRRAEKEKEALQRQLLQTEKLSAIGQLISGVAHELNNPLTGVIGYSQLLAGQECDDRIKQGLEKVYAEARRCHRIVQNLLTFARKHPPEKRLVSVNDILESTIELRAYQLRTDNVAIRSELSPDLPGTMADFHQLQQVFMNIISNAHQAMKEARRGGVLTVRTSRSGDRLRIDIADNGPGIPPENLQKIFDPFFTTKPTGQGTGLGLSICFGIIEEHDGSIRASSEAGAGTVISIELPAVTGEAAGAAATERAVMAEPGGAPAGEQGATRRLLVVDDEPAIADLLSEALRARGHHVDTAINGRLALRKILSGEYDAVITDLKMPGMNGQDLFDEVKRTNPTLAERFVFATGDIVAHETRDFLERAGKPWVEKPFDVERVVDLLGGLLATTA